MAEMLTPLTDANRAGDTRYNLLADNLAEAIRRGNLARRQPFAFGAALGADLFGEH
ncbi:Uncharacterised protein [Ewingella americana]|uniref:Uncharacterized protein n=1 Tax=Ewingella americana TaxID=41202 RepID=A0A377N8V6_9GAMM|nr:Uncharacterised protein [Ewingella americana]